MTVEGASVEVGVHPPLQEVMVRTEVTGTVIVVGEASTVVDEMVEVDVVVKVT